MVDGYVQRPQGLGVHLALSSSEKNADRSANAKVEAYLGPASTSVPRNCARGELSCIDRLYSITQWSRGLLAYELSGHEVRGKRREGGLRSQQALVRLVEGCYSN